MAKVVSFTDLPRLHSTRDSRDRIDLVTEDLFGTSVLKADRITYHPGDTAAAHYHRDCKHFFFVMEGRGVLHTDDEVIDLGPGDVGTCPLKYRLDQAGRHMNVGPRDVSSRRLITL
jgi:mannose-6-phosphate isomerase-like protein (cupin superfamily)